DKMGRDPLKAWCEEVELKFELDQVGNMFGTFQSKENKNEKTLMLGSHIDSVNNEGIYDGVLWVVGALEVVQTIKEEGMTPSRPITVAAFTNEEGVRFPPSMLGSLVYSGDLSLEEALDTVGMDGKRMGDELERIGYKGENSPGFIKPEWYIELHIEQGPILEKENI